MSTYSYITPSQHRGQSRSPITRGVFVIKNPKWGLRGLNGVEVYLCRYFMRQEEYYDVQ